MLSFNLLTCLIFWINASLAIMIVCGKFLIFIKEKNMSKSRETKKETKKEPVHKSIKEKRKAKQEKAKEKGK